MSYLNQRLSFNRSILKCAQCDGKFTTDKRYSECKDCLIKIHKNCEKYVKKNCKPNHLSTDWMNDWTEQFEEMSNEIHNVDCEKSINLEVKF